MLQVTLGRTGITVNKNGFGALPIQRVASPGAEALLRRAYDGGIRFFDTARGYSDSEEKLGRALADVRDEVVLATKTGARTAADFRADLEKSLAFLQTDYVDILQFHNPPFCPLPGGEDGLYDAMLQAKTEGKVRWIGLTNHRLHVAEEAVRSGLYDVLQFPFSYLAGKPEQELITLCARHNIGFIAMKALAGGLITGAEAAYAWMAQHPHVLPIWGIQKPAELEEFLAFQENPPALTAALQAQIDADRADLTGRFCRGCGYCMPCPQGIEIMSCARMSPLLRRSPTAQWLTPHWQAEMAKITTCTHCGGCKTKCPYGLDIPTLLQENYRDYRTFL